MKTPLFILCILFVVSASATAGVSVFWAVDGRTPPGVPDNGGGNTPDGNSWAGGAYQHSAVCVWTGDHYEGSGVDFGSVFSLGPPGHYVACPFNFKVYAGPGVPYVDYTFYGMSGRLYSSNFNDAYPVFVYTDDTCTVKAVDVAWTQPLGSIFVNAFAGLENGAGAGGSGSTTQPSTQPSTTAPAVDNNYTKCKDKIKSYMPTLPTFSDDTSWEMGFDLPWLNSTTKHFDIPISSGAINVIATAFKAFSGLVIWILVVWRIVKDIRAY